MTAFSLRKFLLISVALPLMGVSLSACGDDSAKAGEQKEAQQQQAPQAPKVTVAKPVMRDVREWDEFTGKFEATDSVEIRSRVSGYLNSVHFTDGGVVKKGDLLFVIDPRPFEAAVKQRQADMKVAQAAVEYSTGSYERAAALFRSGDVSAQLHDQRRQERDQALAQLESAKAELEQAKLDLSYTRISAPVSGRISRKLITEGNLIAAGTDALTTIVSLDPIYFYFDVDEQTYLKYTRNIDGRSDGTGAEQKVHIALTDENDYTHEGRMDFVDNTLNPSTGTMRGRAVLENKSMFLTPGMFGRVRLLGGTTYQGALVPDGAIAIDQSRKTVMVVADDGTVSAVAVETGPIIEGLRVIKKGLSGGENVIINGLQRARPGAKVTADQGQITPQANTAANATTSLKPVVSPQSALDAPPQADEPAARPAPESEKPQGSDEAPEAGTQQ